VAAAVLNAGGRLGCAAGDVFCCLRIDDTFYSGGGMPKQRRRVEEWWEREIGGRSVGRGQQGRGHNGGSDDSLGSSGRFAQAQGSINQSATAT
jgi:hypothetical protein